MKVVIGIQPLFLSVSPFVTDGPSVRARKKRKLEFVDCERAKFQAKSEMFQAKSERLQAQLDAMKQRSKQTSPAVGSLIRTVAIIVHKRDHPRRCCPQARSSTDAVVCGRHCPQTLFSSAIVVVIDGFGPLIKMLRRLFFLDPFCRGFPRRLIFCMCVLLLMMVPPDDASFVRDRSLQE